MSERDEESGFESEESSNLLPIAEALGSISHQLKMLGGGQTTDHRGAVEVLAESVVEGAGKIAMAIESLADAIRSTSQR